MILAGAVMALLAVAIRLDWGSVSRGRLASVLQLVYAPMEAIGVLALLAGVLLIALWEYLSSSWEGFGLLADAVRKHGGELPDPSDPTATADAARRCLERYGERVGAAKAKAKEEEERRICIITNAHADLLARHTVTRKMLQSRRAEDVFGILLRGVREGLGFPWTEMGVLDGKGNIVFGSTANRGGGPLIRIPSWDEESIIARTAWKGSSVVLSTLDGKASRREDRDILGMGPAFLVPVTRKPGRTCSEVKSCGNDQCPAFQHAEAKCWIEGFSTCRFNVSNDQEKMRIECSRCEMFAVSAVLVGRSHPASRTITQETAESVAALANDASVALELVKLYEDTRKMSITDGLTGVANHREFYRALRRELIRAKRYGHGVSLLMMDVDNFKKFNDSHGHLAGDAALRKIAVLLRGCVRANDIVARYGGEEFAIILPEASPAGALMLAERIKSEIALINFLETPGACGHLTVSIGIYTAEHGDVSEESMVKFADEAAYRAKHMGKNRVVVKEHA